MCILTMLANIAHSKETVVLLHGLARTSKSMQKMEAKLQANGYETLNLDYPSRKHKVEYLAKEVRKQIVARTEQTTKVHFVTHSMGGILVRQIQKTAPLATIGRVVMLSPPNQGSEVIDRIGSNAAVQQVNGPAGDQLSTRNDGFIARLGPVDFELGVITGDRSINWINSMMIPGKDDGKVSTESAKVEGMADYRVIHATHPMIMKKQSVINETLCFIQNGTFSNSVQ
ncbi:MAG TPA: alpha/beta hydrolase [Opitutae bacterium]|nr:alpha/beta hydrolase [Opitutae bacterium]